VRAAEEPHGERGLHLDRAGVVVSSQTLRKGFGRVHKTCSEGWNRICDSDNERCVCYMVGGANSIPVQLQEDTARAGGEKLAPKGTAASGRRVTSKKHDRVAVRPNALQHPRQTGWVPFHGPQRTGQRSAIYASPLLSPQRTRQHLQPSTRHSPPVAPHPPRGALYLMPARLSRDAVLLAVPPLISTKAPPVRRLNPVEPPGAWAPVRVTTKPCHHWHFSEADATTQHANSSHGAILIHPIHPS
jgi:hypothetical protein